jgi:hypothetical protein
MFDKNFQVGIGVFLVVALLSAAVMSTTVLKTHQVIAQSPKDMESMIKNMSKMGVMITTTPVMCTTLGDIVGAISNMAKGIAANMTSSMTQSNATEGIMGLMNNTNQTNATQGNIMGLIEKGISSSGMENMSKVKLGKMKDFMICNQANEKMMEDMVKEMMMKEYPPTSPGVD